MTAPRTASRSRKTAETTIDLSLDLDGFRVVTSNVSWGEDVPEMRTMLQAVEDYAPDQEPDNWLVTGWITGMSISTSLSTVSTRTFGIWAKATTAMSLTTSPPRPAG